MCQDILGRSLLQAWRKRRIDVANQLFNIFGALVARTQNLRLSAYTMGEEGGDDFF
jgi:hypothetical protein